jgi:hypothetical protein
MKTYTADDFVKELKSDEGLSPLPTLPIGQTGMINPAESTSDEISFAPGIQRSHWVKVPVSIIDKVNHLGNQYEYPYVRLLLKDSNELPAEARAIAGILQSPTGRPYPAPQPAARSIPAPQPTGRPTPAPQPVGRTIPAPQPTSRPTPQPTGRPIPAPQPTSQTMPHPVPTPPNMPGPTKGCG